MRAQDLAPVLKKGAISFFILFHVTAFTVWSSPELNLLGRQFCGAIWNYMTSSGLWQGWMMFAPNPTRTNRYLDARVHFKSGKTTLYTLPRIELAPIDARPGLERWNQWRFVLANHDNAIVWPDAARYIARLHPNPQDPPVKIELLNHWRVISPPSAADYQPMDRSLGYDHHEVLFTYSIEKGDLT